ncbi:AAA family ATPase [Granulosicoccus sp. 3-233]|uniref:AAA family ATPase n=1 Tax=Granulosicoccus sp. 3-233 TaxID=3417969 RepID=UPI003D342C85
MSFIPGFQAGERLYESRNSLIVRASRDSDGLPVVIKILKNDYPSPEELARYRREFEITRSLDLPGVIHSYELRRHEKTLLMVLEDFDGMSLADLMANRSLSLDEFLDAAIQLVEALKHIHQAGIVHKDICPANLVINPGTGEIKFIDFGIATRFSSEQPVLSSPEVLEGTLAYMSPEQTGRMNRTLDYRSDFYSLGATFHEMLTGVRPFENVDFMELVHSHIAREPVPAHRCKADVPLPLSKIVSKLMSKKAENRYQSAMGLLADLETVREGESLERFEAGRSDYSAHFHIPERLYGRDKEVKELLAAFDRASDGRAEMILVGGYSGVGKSALVREIHKPVTAARGYFIAGKFDQMQSNTPYSGMVAALRDLVRQILTESVDGLEQWRADLQAALSPNAQLILDVLPELELVIGPQPTLPELEFAETTNRFKRTIRQFLLTLCSRERMIVLFLDDLQWADSATLSLLEAVLCDEALRHLLLIGAYRDNEVDGQHPLSLALQDIQQGGGHLQFMTVAPLTLTDIVRLLADTLSADRGQLTSLARLIVQKTHGNPLFVRQFLLDLERAGLLTQEASSVSERARWQWDLNAIKAAGITDNVIDLLLGKLQRLPLEAQEALQLAACIGNQFDIDTLALIQHSTREMAFESLRPALHEELIRPLTQLTTSDEDDVLSPLVVRDWCFQHDRIQQAAYSLIEKNRQKQVHLAIGRRLQQTLSPTALKERVFEVVDHLNYGCELIGDEQEKLALAELDLMAAGKAADATAYQSALALIVTAQDLVNDPDWTRHYELTSEIVRQRAKLEYLNGHFNQCSRLVLESLEKSRSDLEKAEVCFTRIAQHTLLTEYQEALEAGCRALQLVGVELPLDDVQTAGEQAIARVVQLMEGVDIDSLIDRPVVDSAEMALAQRCLRHLTIAAFLSNQQLFPLIVGTSVGISLEHGNAPTSALSFSNYGLIIGAYMGRFREGYQFGELALRLCDKFPGKAPTATVCLVHGIELMPWVRHIRHSRPVIDRGYRAGLDSGDILWAGYLVMYRVMLDSFAGKPLDDIIDGIPDQLAFNARTRNPGATACIVAHQIVLSTLAGRSRSSADFSAGEIDESAFLKSCEEHQIAMALCFYRIRKAQALYLFGRPAEALEETRAIEDKLSYIVNHPNLAERLLYQSLALSALAAGQDDDTRMRTMDQLSDNLAQLTLWAEHCPENFLAKRLMVEAEIARLDDRDADALELYDRAIDAAHEGQFLQDEAQANELAARFCLDKRTNSRAGAMYLRDARYALQMWGASRKVEELELEFPQLLTEYRDARTASAGQTAATFGTRDFSTRQLAMANLDLNTLVKAGETLSGEVVLARLLDRLLGIVMENAGAQRGVLLLSRDGELFIEAEASVLSEQASVLMSIPIDSVDGSTLVPAGVIHFAARTENVVVVADAQIDERFMADSYVQRKGSRSLLCQPILSQGKLLGLVYLENELISSAFTPERTRLLSLLSGQIAISINNAELVENLEVKVRERTRQLELHSRFIEQTFGRYLSTEIADSLLKSTDGPDFSGRKTTVTVLMSDLRGFSTFSDSLDPETIVKLLNNYLSEMTTVIQKYNGTIDEFIGDAILVIFGAPFQRADDAERAVACALKMQLMMARVNAWNVLNGLPELEMGIGINTGEVVAGNIGSRKRAKYGVVGSNVNMAGRIEGHTVGGQVLISKSTRDAVQSPLQLVDIGSVEPKGATNPVQLFDVRGLLGNHDLRLPEPSDAWVELSRGLPLGFRHLEGKMLEGRTRRGVMMGLSAREAEIQCRSMPPPFTDLWLELDAADDAPMITGIYGKVLRRSSRAGRFILRFTAMPAEAQRRLLGVRTRRAVNLSDHEESTRLVPEEGQT